MDDRFQAGAEAKLRETVLREARALLRRAERFKASVETVDDEDISILASTVTEHLQRLVRHLVQLDRHRFSLGPRR